MKPIIFFAGVETGESKSQIAEKVSRLFERSGFGSLIKQNDLVAVKMHFGETGNDTHICPEWVKPVVAGIGKAGGNPFLTDTCVLYKSSRNNGVDHARLADNHGFNVGGTGAPVLIADGLLGNEEKEVAIRGRIFKKVSIAPMALDSDALIALSHVTGHMATGIGATLKNLGMGFASKKGKLRQHSVMKPQISEKRCTGCETCVKWCPASAIKMKGGKAVIDPEMCIGCGECFTVCRFGAVKHDWRVGAADLQMRMTEHAAGVVEGKKEKAGYMNFLTSVTKDCDCMTGHQKPIFPDIGIIAGRDPVAVDTAALRLIKERTGKELTDLSYPGLDAWVQIRHGEEIGLGSSEYNMEIS